MDMKICYLYNLFLIRAFHSVHVPEAIYKE